MFCTTCGSQKNEEGVCITCDVSDPSRLPDADAPVYFGGDGSGRTRISGKKRLVILAAILIPVLAVGGVVVSDLSAKAEALANAKDGCTTLTNDWKSESGEAAAKKFKLAAAVDKSYTDLSNGVRKWQTADLEVLQATLEILNVQMDTLSGDYWYLSASEIYIRYTLPQVLKQSAAEEERDAEKAKIVKACAAL